MNHQAIARDAIQAEAEDVELEYQQPNPFGGDYIEEMRYLRQWERENPEQARIERELFLGKPR